MNIITCIIDLFSLNQHVIVHNTNDDTQISQDCTLKDMPEVTVNMANQYDVTKVYLCGNANFAGELSKQMLNMNPLLDIEVKERNY